VAKPIDATALVDAIRSALHIAPSAEKADEGKKTTSAAH
jgi:FixJ family two-component response regulator